MVQTLFGKDIAFSLRTFRFTDGQSSTDDQNQTISCELHLEPADQVSEEQAANCTCYDDDDCNGSYCIEVRPRGNTGNEILILQNDQVNFTIPARFGETQTACFDSFDLQNDIFELRHNGPGDGVSIFVNLIQGEVTTPLFFGTNADVDWVMMDNSIDPIRSDDGLYCMQLREAARSVKIQNNIIIESSCVSPADPSLVWVP